MRDSEFQLEVRDCVEGMREIESSSIDLVVTSPPYNLGIQYSKYQDSMGREDYFDWSSEWVSEVKRVLKDDGSFFLNVGASPSDPLLPHELIVRLKDLFVLQNTIHWIKSITVKSKAGEELSAGHFKPINSGRYINDCHEYVFHLTPTGDTKIDRLAVGVPYSDKSNIARWAHTKGGDKRCRGNNWFIPYKTIRSRAGQRPHPATFPSELAINCIRLHGHDEQTRMLDPFLGIGHSAVAAKTCGIRKFIGFDIDEEYVSVARQRVSEVVSADEPASDAQA